MKPINWIELANPMDSEQVETEIRQKPKEIKENLEWNRVSYLYLLNRIMPDYHFGTFKRYNAAKQEYEYIIALEKPGFGFWQNVGKPSNGVWEIAETTKKILIRLKINGEEKKDCRLEFDKHV